MRWCAANEVGMITLCIQANRRQIIRPVAIRIFAFFSSRPNNLVIVARWKFNLFSIPMTGWCASSTSRKTYTHEAHAHAYKFSLFAATLTMRKSHHNPSTTNLLAISIQFVRWQRHVVIELLMHWAVMQNTIFTATAVRLIRACAGHITKCEIHGQKKNK